MRTTWVPRILLAVSLFASLCAVLASPSHAQSAWAAIGPHGPGAVFSVAFAPNWPRDGLVLALMGSNLHVVRSRDGGQTWQNLPFPGETLSGTNISLVQRPSGRIAFVQTVVAQRGTTPPVVTLYRSIDDGDTWEQVWQGSGSPVTLRLPPTVPSDGVIFAEAGGDLLRSPDAGRSWEKLEPAGDAGIAPMAISPTFAVDHSIVASVLASPSNAAAGIGQPPRRGLALSSDSGATWSPLATPSREGTPYPQLRQIVPSPSFADDGTLFVVAFDRWQALAGGTPATGEVVFRSTDRGQTWETVYGPVPAAASLALSPSFATDRTVLVGTSLAADTEHPDERCNVQRSSDAGTTWDAPYELGVIKAGSGQRCGRAELRQGPEGIVALLGRSLSLDLGQSWQPLTPPDGVTLTGSPSISPDFSHDGTIFVSTENGGNWAFGPGAQPAAGRVLCDVPLADGLAQLYDTVPWVPDHLGCPNSPARQAQFVEQGRVLPGGPYRYIWSSSSGRLRRLRLSDDDPGWSASIEVAARPAMSDREVPGYSQQFDQGSAWVFLGEDGQPIEVIFFQGPTIVGTYRAFEIPR